MAFAVLAAATAAATFGASSSVQDQERSLLKSRAAETRSLLDVAIGAIEQRMLIVAGALQVGPSELETFNKVAESLVAEQGGSFESLALVDTTGDAPKVLTALGSGIRSGATLVGKRAGAVARSGARFVSTGVFEVEGERRWGAAIGAPLLAEGRAIYGESAVQPPAEPEDPNAAFAEIKVVLYGTSEASREQILAANTVEWPLKGPVEEIEFDFGADVWLMEAAPRRSLVGGATRRLPVLVAGLGTLFTVAVVALLEVLQRRRDYALALVDDRTRELEASVHDLERARRELQEADRLKDEFLDIAAHELRTPLTAIAGFAELLTSSEDLDESTRARLLDRVYTNAQVMEELTNQLLDLSRLRAGKVSIDPSLVSVRSAIDDSLTRVGELVDDREVVVAVPDGLEARADAKAFQRILVNLIANAAKFSPAASTITVAAAMENAGVKVEVIDRGVGIRAEDQQQIFERFYRASGTGDVTRGTGVGLTIVSKYVELHGGEVGVDSALGQGSTFWFTLPSHDPDSDVAEEVPSP